MKKTTLVLSILFFSKIIFAQGENEFYIQALKMNRVLYYLDQLYVDTVNTGKTVEIGIVKILESLDPHSTYIPAEDVKAITEQLDGEFEGIGINFSVYKDTLLVVGVITAGPSYKAGLKAGDRIIKIDGENIAGIGLTEAGVMKRLKGKSGSKVNLHVNRKNQELDILLTRGLIPLKSIDAAYRIDEKTIYIKINRFAKTTYNEFIKELQELGTAKNIIIDLCGNVGGYLEVAVELLNEILPQGNLLLYTEGIHSTKKEYRVENITGKLRDSNVVILLDEGTASASEIVSGAIQDWDRGLLVGRRSFGKGLVQNSYLLPDGSVLRLTTSRYFTPSGRLIQKSYDDGKSKYNKDIQTRIENGELTEDTHSIVDSTKMFKTKLAKRTVYGGGGITPDIFVPLDTSKNSKFLREVVNKGILTDFVIEYIDKNREKTLLKFPNIREYSSNFAVSESILNSFLDYAKHRNVICSKSDFQTSKEELSIFIKAIIAGDIWDTNSYYFIINERNNTLKKAIELLNSKNYTYLLSEKK